MKFLDLARSRQSVRRYLDRPVDRAVIDRCLEAARLAPSACNSQPWSFLVVDDPAVVRAVSDAAFSGIYRMNRWAATAPVLIVVITGKSKYYTTLGGQVRDTRYNLIDVGIAGEHIALQAAEEGLGTCWMGWFNEKAVKRLLGLPRRTKTDIIISLGYPADERVREKQREPLDAIRTYYASNGDGAEGNVVRPPLPVRGSSAPRAGVRRP